MGDNRERILLRERFCQRESERWNRVSEKKRGNVAS
jgi:hypothetical protein